MLETEETDYELHMNVTIYQRSQGGRLNINDTIQMPNIENLGDLGAVLQRFHELGHQLRHAAAGEDQAAEPDASEYLAETAFMAYANAVGWTNHLGRPIPTWPCLGEEIRAAWIAAAKAVRPIQHSGPESARP